MGRGPGLPAKTRGLFHGPGGRRHRRSTSTQQIMGGGPAWPVKTRGPPHRLGKAAHLKPTFYDARPGPAHQILSRWAATWPGPSNFQRMGRGPARPINFSEDGPRLGPAH